LPPRFRGDPRAAVDRSGSTAALRGSSEETLALAHSGSEPRRPPVVPAFPLLSLFPSGTPQPARSRHLSLGGVPCRALFLPDGPMVRNVRPGGPETHAPALVEPREPYI